MIYHPPTPRYTTGAWVVATRTRGRWDRYEVHYDNRYVGQIERDRDGWRWRTTWIPATHDHPIRDQERVSEHAYPRPQDAVAALAETDVGRLIAGQDSPAGRTWRPTR